MIKRACFVLALLAAVPAARAEAPTTQRTKPPSAKPPSAKPPPAKPPSAKPPPAKPPPAKPPAPLRAEDFQVRQGKWSFDPSGVLTCEGRSLSSLLYRKGFTARDLELSVEVMFLGPSSSAGLFLRARGQHFYDDTTFYQFEWYNVGHHHDRRLSLMVKNPRWKQIVVPIRRAPPYEQWIELRLRAEGEHLEAFVDGQRVFEKRDRTFLRSGSVGLHVFQPRAVKFRNFQLQRLPSDPPR